MTDECFEPPLAYRPLAPRVFGNAQASARTPLEAFTEDARIGLLS